MFAYTDLKVKYLPFERVVQVPFFSSERVAESSIKMLVTLSFPQRSVARPETYTYIVS